MTISRSTARFKRVALLKTGLFRAERKRVSVTVVNLMAPFRMLLGESDVLHVRSNVPGKSEANVMGVPQPILYAPLRLPEGTRVLIVEDQPFVALAVSDMVVALGGEVADAVATIEEALNAVARNDFAVALLDIDLDGRPSLPVATAIAAAGKPFLITTGFSGRQLEGFETAPFLLKPYLPSQLGRCLAALVEPRSGLV
jgi:CheY-like chemotaxis protein